MDRNEPENGGRPEERAGMLARMKTEARTDAQTREKLHAEAARSRRARQAQSEGKAARFTRRLLWRIILLAALVLVIVAVLAIWAPKIQESLRIDVDLPDSFSELLPDEEMGYNKIRFQEAILGQTREKSELVVLEQDVQVTSEISQALANIALFEKTQTLISYGVGVYAVDLSGVGAGEIGLDETARLITVTIPHAKLAYVQFDVTRTESGETRRALFGFGDIKLTTEQTTLLETSIEAAMREKLGASEALHAADERALILVRELLDPLVKSVAADFAVKVIMPAA